MHASRFLAFFLFCLLIFSVKAARLYGYILIPKDVEAENITIKIIGEEFSYLYYTYDEKNYSIELTPGHYIISAELYSSYGELYTFSNETNISEDKRIDIVFELPKKEFPYTFLFVIVLLILAVLFFFYQSYQKEQRRYYQRLQTEEGPFENKDRSLQSNSLNEEEKPKIEEPSKKEETSHKPASFEVEFEEEEKAVKPDKSELSSDLRKILLGLKLNRGRMTKKKLKSLMKCSAVKLEAMLSELERFGYITKRKQRGEVVLMLADAEAQHSKQESPKRRLSQKKNIKEKRKLKFNLKRKKKK